MFHKDYPQPAYHAHDLTQIITQAADQELYNCELYLRLRENNKIKSKADLIHASECAYQQDWEHYLCLVEHIESINSTAFKQHLKPTPCNKSRNLSLCSLLKALKKSERLSIHYHEKICSMTLGHDYKTFDLAYSMLNDNLQHEDSVASYLDTLI